MRTAIYIPDDIFNWAEKIARHMKITRSEFYAKAIKEYLGNLDEENITQRLDLVYKDHSSKIDPKFHCAQSTILEKEEW